VNHSDVRRVERRPFPTTARENPDDPVVIHDLRPKHPEFGPLPGGDKPSRQEREDKLWADQQRDGFGVEREGGDEL
jgi:hypothetical protein